MSKRKNPLKDLDAFLKQEAKNFVQPNAVKQAPPVVQEKAPEPAKAEEVSTLSKETVVDFMANLSKSNHKEFYNVLKTSIEKSGIKNSEDKMLINTLLYLKDKDNWKENIQTYWS